MAVSHLELTRREPFAFDYERLDGDGKVRFWADFVLLQPLDPARGNRRLLSYVVNRGQRVGVPFNRAAPRLPTLPPTDEIDAGDRFLMRRGWTVAFCGWQWDVDRQPGLMGLEAPQAVGPDGQPLPGKVTVAFQPNELQSHHHLSH